MEITSPDFVKLAEAYGMRGLRATTTSEVDGAIREAMAYNEGPILVEFVVAKEDNVYPMIPAGQTVDEMMDNPEPAAWDSNGSAEREAFMVMEKG